MVGSFNYGEPVSAKHLATPKKCFKISNQQQIRNFFFALNITLLEECTWSVAWLFLSCFDY